MKQTSRKRDEALALANRWIAAWPCGKSRPAAAGTANNPLALQQPPAVAPFAFDYRGQPSSELLPAWKVRRAKPVKRGERLVHVTTWTDPESGLECRLELEEFPGQPAVEWVVYFRNGGTSDTPPLSNIQALDAVWQSGGAQAVLNRSLGSPCTIRDFEYRSDPVPAGGSLRMAAGGGRSSNDWLPFFNLQTGAAGVMVAVGWSGQWAAEFAAGEDGAVRLKAGLERTHLRLHPGEEIRSPRMLLLFWAGDRMDAHNRWRRFLLERHVPRVNGAPIQAPLTMAHWGGMQTAGHLERLAVYRKQKLNYDFFWVDAGWYGLNSTFSPDEFSGDWARHTGDWRVNPKAHPNGLKPLGEAVRQAGMPLMLWVEPERAIAGTHWPDQHPDWFLGKTGEKGATLLLNLGHPEARKAATDLVSGLITETAGGCYRQDFNMDPLPFWRAHDAEDRQGMTEIRHVEGLYAFWDDLLARHPGLIIDNCSSGGRRIDLETISRSIPMWRSDWQCWRDNDPIGGQVHGMGLSHWIPLHGTGTYNSMATRERFSVYRVRSNMGPSFMLSTFPYESTPVAPDYPWTAFRRMVRDFRRAQPLYRGDYYPLTPCSPAPDQWAAYQMDRPDLKEGMVMALRRKESPYQLATFRPRALDPKAVYEIEDADNGRRRRIKGKTLAEKGLSVEIKEPENSRLLFYRKTS